MTAVFTNRLIGSAILVVAAVVFLPDLLDGQKQVNKDDFKAIPERPEFAEVAKPAVFSQDQHQAAKNTAMAPVTDNSQPLDAPVSGDVKVAEPDLSAGDINAAAGQTDPEPTTMTPAATTVQSSTQPSATTQSATTQAAVAASGNVQAATLPADTLPAEITTTGPSVAEKPAEVKVEKPLSKAAFVVKVGSFGKEQNANALVSKLKAAGHNAFTRKIVNSQGVTMVSVLVGPDLKRDQLEAKLTELQQLAQVPKLKVSSYQPVENN
jgi:DedD protein